MTECNLIRRLLKNRPRVISDNKNCSQAVLLKAWERFLPIELLNDCCVLPKMPYPHQALAKSLFQCHKSTSAIKSLVIPHSFIILHCSPFGNYFYFITLTKTVLNFPKNLDTNQISCYNEFMQNLQTALLCEKSGRERLGSRFISTT